MATTTNAMPTCQWCGNTHRGVCPAVKAIEYHADGSIKRVEFKTAQDYPAIEPGPTPFWDSPVLASQPNT